MSLVRSTIIDIAVSTNTTAVEINVGNRLPKDKAFADCAVLLSSYHTMDLLYCRRTLCQTKDMV